MGTGTKLAQRSPGAQGRFLDCILGTTRIVEHRGRQAIPSGDVWFDQTLKGGLVAASRRRQKP